MSRPERLGLGDLCVEPSLRGVVFTKGQRLAHVGIQPRPDQGVADPSHAGYGPFVAFLNHSSLHGLALTLKDVGIHDGAALGFLKCPDRHQHHAGRWILRAKEEPRANR